MEKRLFNEPFDFLPIQQIIAIGVVFLENKINRPLNLIRGIA